MEKYLVLDFGNVLAGPATGNWFITPNFWNYVDRAKENEVKEKLFEFGYMIGEKLITEQEEYEMFKRYYTKVLIGINENENVEQRASEIASDFVYNDDKYTLFEDTKVNLERLSKKYTLLLLSDNWPCAFRIMENWNIAKYFEKIYISSVYACLKQDGIFFDFPIKEYNLNKENAMFVDDNAKLLKVADKKGIVPILMDHNYETNECEYKIIHSLSEID